MWEGDQWMYGRGVLGAGYPKVAGGGAIVAPGGEEAGVVSVDTIRGHYTIHDEDLAAEDASLYDAHALMQFPGIQHLPAARGSMPVGW